MRLNVEVKKTIYEELLRHCSREGRSVSEVVRSLVTDWNARKRREEMHIMDLAREVNDESGGQVG